MRRRRFLVAAAAGVGLVTLKKGYDHWDAAIGSDARVLNVLLRGEKLIFQAVVRANGDP
jgi:hypothetical protein